MSDIKEAVEAKKPNLPKKMFGANKGGRPKKYVSKTGVTKESRVPITGSRDILAVDGQDPNYHYYWALDTSEYGAQIIRLQDAGYNFVQSSEVRVGQTSVFTAAGIGSIVRVSAGGSGYHYLMKIPMEWHLDDLKHLEEKNKAAEATIKADERQDGFYGSIKLG